MAWSVLVLLGLGGCNFMAQGQNAEGVRMHQQGSYPQALQKFQQALYSDPNNADAYYNMAATYHRMGKLSNNRIELDQAEGYYNQCLDRDPNHVDCHRALAVLLVEENRSEEACRLIERWADRNPSLADPKVELARLFEEFGNKEAAKQHLVDALAVNPYDSRALAALGRIHEEMGNPEQALTVYQRSLWYDHLQPEVSARVAALQSALGPQPQSAPGTRPVGTMLR